MAACWRVVRPRCPQAALQGTVFTGASLRCAKITLVEAGRGAVFVDADLSGASITDSSLPGASFVGASLVNVSVEDVHLELSLFGRYVSIGSGRGAKAR